jgi:hypothetical protein
VFFVDVISFGSTYFAFITLKRVAGVGADGVVAGELSLGCFVPRFGSGYVSVAASASW